MESMLNRLRDTVSATVYQVTTNLSTALPGNPLTREYELLQQIGSAGPGLIWKIYSGQKKSTKELVSLFLLEKKSLEKFSKKEKELLLESIRNGVQQLTRLRHPSILTIQHSIEESRDLIAFVTEPVLGSLVNFYDSNFPNSELSSADGGDGSGEKFYDVEIKYGLLQISEGLLFLHKDVKILHRNLCPENILINRNGIWKISGFDFSCCSIKNSTSSQDQSCLLFPSLKIIPDLSLEIQANFSYQAPEIFFKKESINDQIDQSTDIYSLGMISYYLYNNGKPLLQFNSSYQYQPEKFAEDLKLKLTSSLSLQNIPEDLRKHFKLLINFDPKLRPNVEQLTKLQIFDDIFVKTLQYFDQLFQWDFKQKSQFYKNLPELLPKIPKRVKLRRIIYGLSKEILNPEMIPFILPPLFLIAKDTTDDEFHQWIQPELLKIFPIREPIQIGIYLLKNLNFLIEKFKSKPESLKENILPLIYRFLELDSSYQIQELCLNQIPSIIHLIDFHGCKNMLLPRLKKLSLETKLLSVRVNCLICLGKILENLDKWLVLDEVLPLVMMMPSREPAVIMCSVGIFSLTLNSNKLGITKEILATKIIPFLVPLSIENGLTLQQFTTIMNLIRDILNKIEDEHQLKLKQLDSIKIQQDSFFLNSNQNNNNSSEALKSADDEPFDPFKLNESNVGNFNESKSSSSSSKLTLNDKERLVFELEQQEKFNKNQNQILMISSPTSSTSIESSSQKQPPKTKDLTDQLINSNLNFMQQQQPSLRQPQQQIFPTNPISGVGGSGNFFPSSSSFSINNNSTATNNTTTTKKPDLSALDKIPLNNFGSSKFSSTSNNKPMNSMKTNNNNSSLMMMSMQNQNQNQNSHNNKNNSSELTKKLSQKDLEEFLN